jgi:hypothetical protein
MAVRSKYALHPKNPRRKRNKKTKRKIELQAIENQKRGETNNMMNFESRNFRG